MRFSGLELWLFADNARTLYLSNCSVSVSDNPVTMHELDIGLAAISDRDVIGEDKLRRVGIRLVRNVFRLYLDVDSLSGLIVHSGF